MGQRNTSLTVALCVSLIAHGLGLSAMAWWYARHNLFFKTPPIDKYQVLADRLYQQMKQDTPPPPPPVAVKKPTPPPAQKLEKPSQTRKDDSGEANGTGTANRSTDGQQPMQAEAGYEQANLMKPADDFADDAFLPASAGKDRGNNADQQRSPRLGTYVPDFTPEASSLADASAKTPVTATPAKGLGPLPKVETLQVASAVASGTKDPIPNVPLSQSPSPKPVEKEIRGHRATVSDTESIALARVNSGVFRAGRLVGRKGLKVKTSIPRFGDASYADIQLLGGVRTIVQARVDADGKVQDVQIVQSSGSPNVDQDCKTAVWDWTLEPEKDKAGHPIDYTWTIAFE